MKKIEKEEYYSIKDASGYLRISRYFVKKLMQTSNLKFSYMNSGHGKRYFIKGAWIISLKEKIDQGKVTI